MDTVKSGRTRDDVLDLQPALTREHVFIPKKLLTNALRIKGIV